MSEHDAARRGRLCVNVTIPDPDAFRELCRRVEWDTLPLLLASYRRRYPIDWSGQVAPCMRTARLMNADGARDAG